MSLQNHPQALATLTTWLSIKNQPYNCDIIFAFGGATMDIPYKALELYRQGYAPYIVVTGKSGTFGNPDWDNQAEADIFRNYLVAHGVPNRSIICENTSTNTLENVLFTQSKIEKLIPQLRSAILITSFFHQRRACLTFQKQYPNVDICNYPAKRTPQEESIEHHIQRCLEEYERIIKYTQKGDLAQIKIPEVVIEAYNILKSKS